MTEPTTHTHIYSVSTHHLHSHATLPTTTPATPPQAADASTHRSRASYAFPRPKLHAPSPPPPTRRSPAHLHSFPAQFCAPTTRWMLTVLFDVAAALLRGSDEIGAFCGVLMPSADETWCDGCAQRQTRLSNSHSRASTPLSCTTLLLTPPFPRPRPRTNRSGRREIASLAAACCAPVLKATRPITAPTHETEPRLSAASACLHTHSYTRKGSLPVDAPRTLTVLLC